jgi:hypothetical protein
MAATAPKMSASGLEASMEAAPVLWGGPEPVVEPVGADVPVERVALLMVLLVPELGEGTPETEVLVTVLVMVAVSEDEADEDEAEDEAVEEADEAEDEALAEPPERLIKPV